MRRALNLSLALLALAGAARAEGSQADLAAVRTLIREMNTLRSRVL